MPQNSAQTAFRLAIVGGGIAGLAAAWRAKQLNPAVELTLFEAGELLGGTLGTLRQDGYLIERSADSFITNVPWALELCRSIGFVDQLIPTKAAYRSALVVHNGRLYPVPEGFLLMAPNKFWPLATTPLLSFAGKLRVAREYFVPAKRNSGDESLASFARRRLGREAFERLVQPLVGGIYTADPEKLSLAATLPRFLEMERQHGGLIRAILADRKKSRVSAPGNPVPESGARYGLFVTPREGMSSLVAAIAEKLPPNCVRLNHRIISIERANSRLRLSNNNTQTDFDAVILATPAPAAASLLKSLDAPLATELNGIEHASSAVVILGYRRDQISHPLDGFGFVVPTVEKRRILSASFSSVKFPDRAPEGKVLIRVFLGGALQPEILQHGDEQLLQIARDELGELIGATGQTDLNLVFRWPGGMPQYHLGHLERLRQMDERLSQIPGLALAGNAYEGVGLPQCIRSGFAAAERVLHATLTTR